MMHDNSASEWWVPVLLALIALAVLLIVLVIILANRRHREVQAHLAVHGIDSHAAVINLVRGNLQLGSDCSSLLVLRWRHPQTGAEFLLQSDSLWLKRLHPLESDAAIRERALARIHLLPEWPVRLDPRDPLRYHQVGAVQPAQAILEGGD